jgi:hypothetical protein
MEKQEVVCEEGSEEEEVGVLQSRGRGREEVLKEEGGREYLQGRR